MRYYAKRIGQSVLTLFVVVTITFFMYRLLPGGPLELMRQQLLQDMATQGTGQANMQEVNRLIELYTGFQPDAPLYVQYYNYIKDIVVHQDFGKSIWQNEPVFDILFKAMPWSIYVSVYGLVLGFSTNVFLGAFMAYREGSRFDSGMTGIIVAANSVPYYAAAIFMLIVFSYQLGWFPIAGRYGPATTPGFNVDFMVSVVHHSILPIFTGFVVGFGGGALGMRGNSVRILGEDYVRSARLRGLSSRLIAARYVGKNAILPMYTGLMIGLAGIFSSSVIMEQIFTYPGVGWYTFGALENRDYPLLLGSFIFFTTITITGITIADMTYSLIDPRIESGGEDESF